MPRAGFYAVESGRISFRHDGNWYSDDERIDNPRIALLFSRSLRQDPAGNFFLQVGDERAAVDIEDTPYVVTRIDPLPADGFRIFLNDGESEALDCTSLAVGADNVLYCAIKGGRYRARVLRPAYYQMAPYFEENGRGGYVLRAGSRHYSIKLSAEPGASGSNSRSWTD
jgi:uncharacterized protein